MRSHCTLEQNDAFRGDRRSISSSSLRLFSNPLSATFSSPLPVRFLNNLPFAFPKIVRNFFIDASLEISEPPSWCFGKKGLIVTMNWRVRMLQAEGPKILAFRRSPRNPSSPFNKNRVWILFTTNAKQQMPETTFQIGVSYEIVAV